MSQSQTSSILGQSSKKIYENDRKGPLFQIVKSDFTDRLYNRRNQDLFFAMT